jgi:hypothetical protein
MNDTRIKKDLSAKKLIRLARDAFSNIPDPRLFSTKNIIKFTDILMSGLAIYGLKFPSLLQYDRNRKESAIEKNLRSLYLIDTPPSDTYLRERLDELDPLHLRSAFKDIFSHFQQNKGLDHFKFLDDHCLVSVDGSEYFSSSTINCACCCKRENKTKGPCFYHQMLGACIVHPDMPNVIPFCPEPIKKSDGDTKNDCERNATKRFLEKFREEHPNLKVIILADGLASNGPNIKNLEEYEMKYILGAKPGDHQYLFKVVEESRDVKYTEYKDGKGILHQFRYLNEVFLNHTHSELKVNFLEYMQTNTNGEELRFSWVTNIHITEDNAYTIMRGGRARWKVENELFNSIKNSGYNFEHNYGHGKKNLTTVLALLMMLAFLIDQIQAVSCSIFKALKKVVGSSKQLWTVMRVLFEYVEVDCWETFYRRIGKNKLLDST